MILLRQDKMSPTSDKDELEGGHSRVIHDAPVFWANLYTFFFFSTLGIRKSVRLQLIVGLWNPSGAWDQFKFLSLFFHIKMQKSAEIDTFKIELPRSLGSLQRARRKNEWRERKERSKIGNFEKPFGNNWKGEGRRRKSKTWLIATALANCHTYFFVTQCKRRGKI